MHHPETDARLAEVWPASSEAIETMLSHVIAQGYRWQWLRLQNGDLMFGVFPKGDVYESLEPRVTDDFYLALHADKDNGYDPPYDPTIR